MRVVGLGDQVVDKYEHTHTMYPGGNAMNFAAFAKKMGLESAFVGAFGVGEEAEHVQDSARALGIDLSHCKVYEGENGHAFVTLKDGDRVFLGSNRCGVLREIGLHLTQEDYEYLRAFDLVHSGLYGFAEEDMQKLHAWGVATSYDFSSDFQPEQLARMLPHVDYAFFSASHLSDAQRQELAQTALDAGCKLVLCTRGAEGAVLYTKEKEYFQAPHFVQAKDTMAAGDAFITCFILTYLQNRSQMEEDTAIKTALEAAAEFAAQQCLLDGSFGYGKHYD